MPHARLTARLLAGLLLAHTLATQAAPRVYRDRVEPHWFRENTAFWYRNDLPEDRREFLLVDALASTRFPAFHHSRVAEALANLTGTPIDAGKLPIESLEVADDLASILLRGTDATWKLDLESGALSRESAPDADAGLPAESEPRPSRNGGRESAITFRNRLSVPVQLVWVNPEGQRVPYGTLGPGESRRQHTFAGHVWLVLENGRVRAVFEAARDPAAAQITEATPTRRRTNRNNGRPDEPRVERSPDGRREAFVRDQNLWFRDVPSGTEHPLSFDATAAFSFRRDVQGRRMIGLDYDAPEPPPTLPRAYWSHDGRHVLAIQTRAVPERRVHLIESSPGDQLQPRLASYPYLKPGDPIPQPTARLFCVEPVREIPIPHDAFPNPWSLDEFQWAPDGSHITFLHNERGHRRLQVLAVDLPAADAGEGATARVRVIVHETSPTFIDYSNKTFLQFLKGSGDLIWMSERSGCNHLHRIDAATGTVRNAVTSGNWVVREVEHLDATAGQVWIRVMGLRPDEDPYHVHLARVNLDGTGFTPLTEGDGTHEVQWSPDRRWFLDTWSRVDLPPVTELRRASDGARVCVLEEADASEVLAARGRFPQRFSAPGRDGQTPIWGIVHRPANFEPGRKYPVIENIYAGPHGAHVPKAFRADYRHQGEIADRGFVVVQIDGMGTNWRSKRFHDVAARNLADAGFPDRIAWLRAAAAAFPELDLDRVGIYGGSAGGQNAVRALLAHGDFYRAAVADCGCHDNRMDKIWWNEAWMGWPVGPHYAEQSNVTQAHRLQGHLMLVVGELDRNVDPASTLQLVNALVKADKPFDFLLIPGAGHGACETDYGRRRRADFFVRHLRGEQ